jgi:hypothetical protein
MVTSRKIGKLELMVITSKGIEDLKECIRIIAADVDELCKTNYYGIFKDNVESIVKSENGDSDDLSDFVSKIARSAVDDKIKSDEFKRMVNTDEAIKELRRRLDEI